MSININQAARGVKNATGDNIAIAQIVTDQKIVSYPASLISAICNLPIMVRVTIKLTDRLILAHIGTGKLDIRER